MAMAYGVGMRHLRSRLTHLAMTIVALSILWPAGSLPAMAADPAFPPGSRIGLVPPPEMTPSLVFPGFEDRTLHAAIEISELAAQSYDSVARQFNPDSLRIQGVDVRLQEEITLQGGGRAELIVARPVGGQPPVTRWTLLGRLRDVTAVVTFYVPDSAQDVYTDKIVYDTLQSVVLRPRLTDPELLGLLPYKLNELAGFRVLRAHQNGALMLTDGPVNTPLPVQQPFLLITMRNGTQPDIADREAAARRALGTVAGMERFRITRSEAIRINSRQGHEIVGETVDPPTNTPLTAVQWLIFTGGTYVQLYAIARTDVWDKLLPRLRAIRDGLGER